MNNNGESTGGGNQQRAGGPDLPDDPAPTLWQIVVGKIVAVIWVFGTMAWLTYFGFFYEGAFDRPLTFLQEMLVCAVAASMLAALLTQLFHSRGIIRGTLKGVGFTFTGATAFFLVLLWGYFQLRPVEDYPTAVVYTVTSSTHPGIRMDLKAFQVGHQPGEEVALYKQKLGSGETWKVIVVYPPEVYSATVRLKSEEGTHDFKLYNTDGETRNTRLLIPSGDRQKE